ncbi:hypothetical protein [Oceanobacillus massiliensis]|uniref:hypothetical protein n=1 Tax=Oceanobacillus massiliensis TaxID=1465765 RepID=UPI00028A0F5E|nr:hypothetical protein [Oceanobacillus massiliensis]
MYAVSEQFKNAIQDNTRSYYWDGKITTKDGREFSFTNEEIVKGSGYISNQCSGSTEIEIGSVYAAELGITLFSNIDRYSLENGTIELFFHLEIALDVYETVPMGVYEITEANRTVKCLEIKAYDYMLRFDKSFSFEVSNGTPHDFIALACEKCGVEMAQTKEEIDSMPNGAFVFGIYTENDIETWRDLIYYIAQVLGCFATINRVGKLEFRKYGNVSVMDVPNTQRFSSSFSDFVTRYTAINSTNIRTKQSEYYALQTDDALTMNLGVNPLLQFGLIETRTTILENILNDLSLINYLPFDSTTIGNPALDLGDIITFSGGQADETQITTITKITYRINGKHTLKCVGKNPRLSRAKSKNDKNITGLLNQIEAGKIVVHSYLNASPFTISTINTDIISIEFASNEDTDAQFNASILLNVKADVVEKIGQAVGTITIPPLTEGGAEIKQDENFTLSWSEDGKAVIEVTYSINDFTITTYHPKETLGSGDHILNLYYPLTGLKAGTYNTFRVRLKITGGTAKIERSQAIAAISGQGLAASKTWDGRLELSDELPTVRAGGGINPISFEDQVNYKFLTPTLSNITEGYQLLSLGGMPVATFEEGLQVNPVIIKETITVSDKNKMEYSSEYVNTVDRFELQTNYSFISSELLIDRGRLCKVTANTEQFSRVDGLEVVVNG